jgi:hypothetical protein
MHKAFVLCFTLALGLALSTAQAEGIRILNNDQPDYQRVDSRRYSTDDSYDDQERFRRYQPPQQQFLTPQQLNQQQFYDANQNDRRSGNGNSRQCREQVQQAARAAAKLSEYARRLRMCAESQNFNDDCGNDFRRVTHAHSDYDEAVSMVRRECR